MSNTSGVTSIPAMNYLPIGGPDANVTTMSAESLLAYCQMQLGDMDTQINAQMSTQKTAMREREAVESAQTVLEQFGTDGPQDPQSMHRCVNAIDQAIAQLPQGDPIAAQLTDFRSQLCLQYDYLPPGSLTQPDQSETAGDTGLRVIGGPVIAESPFAQRIDQPSPNPDGVLGRKPNKDNKEWQGTTDALANVANDIKSNAEIQMLQLQDLVSQRQQAVQLCSGMMSKTDQTLEDQAKAIGR